MYRRTALLLVTALLFSLLAPVIAEEVMPLPIKAEPEYRDDIDYGMPPDDIAIEPVVEEYAAEFSLTVKADNTGTLVAKGPISDGDGTRFEGKADLGSTFSVKVDGWSPDEGDAGVVEFDYTSDGKKMSYGLNVSAGGVPVPLNGYLDTRTTRTSVSVKGRLRADQTPGEIPDIAVKLKTEGGSASISLDTPDLPADQVQFALGAMNQEFAQEGVATRVEDFNVVGTHVDVKFSEWQDILIAEARREMTPSQAGKLEKALANLGLDLSLTVKPAGVGIDVSFELDARNLGDLSDLVMELTESPVSIPILREGENSISFSTKGQFLDLRATGEMEHVDYDVGAIAAALRDSCLEECRNEGSIDQGFDMERRIVERSPSIIDKLITGTGCSVKCDVVANIVTSALNLDLSKLAISLKPQMGGVAFSIESNGHGMDQLVANVTKAARLDEGEHIPILRGGSISITADRAEVDITLAETLEQRGDVFNFNGELPGHTTVLAFEDTDIATFVRVDAKPEPDERNGNVLTWKNKAGQSLSVEAEVKIDDSRLKASLEKAESHLVAVEKLQLSEKDEQVAEQTRSILEEASRLIADGEPAKALALLEESSTLLKDLPEVEVDEGPDGGAVLVIGLIIIAVMLAVISRRGGGGGEEIVTVRSSAPVRTAPPPTAAASAPPTSAPPPPPTRQPAFEDKPKEYARVEPQDEWDTL